MFFVLFTAVSADYNITVCVWNPSLSRRFNRRRRAITTVEKSRPEILNGGHSPASRSHVITSHCALRKFCRAQDYGYVCAWRLRLYAHTVYSARFALECPGTRRGVPPKKKKTKITLISRWGGRLRVIYHILPVSKCVRACVSCGNQTSVMVVLGTRIVRSTRLRPQRRDGHDDPKPRGGRVKIS